MLRFNQQEFHSMSRLVKLWAVSVITLMICWLAARGVTYLFDLPIHVTIVNGLTAVFFFTLGWFGIIFTSLSLPDEVGHEAHTMMKDSEIRKAGEKLKSTRRSLEEVKLTIETSEQKTEETPRKRVADGA